MLTRRSFLEHSALAFAGIAASRAGVLSTNSTVVRTKLGILRGENTGEVNVFRGVPFAEAPVGPLRFRAPEAARPWAGVRDALRFASAAPQPGQKAIPQSEDCLYLNIWAPRSTGPRPVLVWIHGGGFTGGRSFDPLFDGSSFARDGVVCVTIGYRLGVLGFLDVEPLLGASYRGSADNALRDVVAALEWVRANIADFGGDPHRVTVGGESAGAKMTDLLMSVPSAAPLFQQMISESGGADRIWPLPRALAIGKDFGALWAADHAKTAGQLRSASMGEILDAQERFTAEYPVHFPLRPEIDGSLIPASPLAGIRKGLTRGKRLLLGTNRDESALFLGPHPAADPTARDLGNLTLEQFDAIAGRYQTIYPDMSEPLRRIRSVSAEEYWIPSLRVADAHVSAGGTAFVYRFDFPGASGRFAGLAFHSYEMHFVWDNFAQQATAKEQTFALSVHEAWVSFLKGERPVAAGLPLWPKYSLTQRPTMILNAASSVENAPQDAEFHAWDGLLTG